MYYELGSATWGNTDFLSFTFQAAASQLIFSSKLDLRPRSNLGYATAKR
jgi:hypothetical protein